LPTAGSFYELDAIGAAAIGGASLSGGAGSIAGTLFGALLIAVLKNGLSILNVSSYLQQIVVGVIIVTAVALDRKRMPA
jgi:ribose/xylose/arabinose/galactoside ABC-type transport system permease subunit